MFCSRRPDSLARHCVFFHIASLLIFKFRTTLVHNKNKFIFYEKANAVFEWLGRMFRYARSWVVSDIFFRGWRHDSEASRP